MSRLVRSAVAIGGAAVAAAALTLSGTATAATPSTHGTANACSQAVPAGYAACFSKVVTVNGHAMTSSKPFGLSAAQIRSAYNLNGASSGGKTVAIIDAYDDPNAESDLAVYRTTNGLSACTTANGCFKKVNQRGGSSYPAGNTGWGLEISLDLDAVSAACPDCHILLVEADGASLGNLGKAVMYAASQPGVVSISNSYGGNDRAQAAKFKHKGIAVVASTGDDGYGVSSPASFTDVVAVGGTSLHTASNGRGWTETAWSGAGSGCSTLNKKPDWQTAATKCSGKANADVSAVADPNTGLSVYDTYGYGGFIQVGGTSLSSPIIGAVYAQGPAITKYAGQFTWSKAKKLYDVTSGSNGTCSPSVWCHAGTGWDGPTGLGTPNGTAAF